MKYAANITVVEVAVDDLEDGGGVVVGTETGDELEVVNEVPEDPVLGPELLRILLNELEEEPKLLAKGVDTLKETANGAVGSTSHMLDIVRKETYRILPDVALSVTGMHEVEAPPLKNTCTLEPFLQNPALDDGKLSFVHLRTSLTIANVLEMARMFGEKANGIASMNVSVER